jgi:hypothetical protein
MTKGTRPPNTNTERQPNASISAFATKPLIAAPSVKPTVMLVGEHAENDGAREHPGVSPREQPAERRSRDVPFCEHRRRNEAHHLDVEPIHDQRRETQREHADLQPADPAVVHDFREIDRSGRGASCLHHASPNTSTPGVERGAPWTAQAAPTIP